MLTDEEFRLFRNLIQKESGIFLKETRKDFVEHRIMKRIAATGVTGPYWYYRLLLEKKSELLILLDRMTINETSFFRNRPQMDLFRNRALPEILQRKRNSPDRSLKIWSAGCSTGEEPYTIAVLVREALPSCQGWDIKIFASDLSLTALEKANRGEYAVDRVEGAVDTKYISRYFEGARDSYRIKDEIRKMVVFDYHNLMNDNGMRDIDIVFCRNVMIYFDSEEQKALIDRFCQILLPGGFLFVGHAESLQGLNTCFCFVHENLGTAYKKHTEEPCLKY